ncbi:MAG TPA: RecX family transcriptional regulator [Allosphingosinicella sp.]|nr:RecX family transcriptional regulator [Allosphingosinicella sp.]
MAERLAGLGFIDDRAVADARAASLQRRGFGVRRVTQALRAAGIAEADAADVLQRARGGAVAAGLRFAERKRIGPYARDEAERGDRRKAFAAMMRAGHSPEVARIVLDIRGGEIPDCDSD